MSCKISIGNENKRKVVKMCEMEPLQIGRIIKSEHMHYRDHIVMRTASTLTFEVMDLTKFNRSECWTSPTVALGVELFHPEEVLTLKILNGALLEKAFIGEYLVKHYLI